MKAFFTVTEDSLSRRMGIFKLRFTLYIMCKFINGKGEEKNCQQSFTIFSIDVTGNAGVFVFVFFLSCCHTHVNKNHNTAGMVRFRQLGWPLTSGVNLQLSLCR